MTKKLKPKINTSFGGWIDKTSYKKLSILILIIITLFSIIYYFLNPLGHGTDKSDLSIIDSVYFSVVTFTTLGYGDISPIGLSKILVIIEVTSGLFLAAIFIGKISSERQSTKLTLIYSSINHQRILGLIEEVSRKENELMHLYNTYNNKKLKIESKNAYDLASVIRKYLTLQSLEGELAAYGNSSTLRRLYLALAKIQKTVAIISKTYGISEDIITISKRTISTIGEVGINMKQFHQSETKILANLNELVLEAERNQSPKSIVYRKDINEELIRKVESYSEKYPDLLANHTLIAEELGMTNNQCKKCIDAINNNA